MGKKAYSVRLQNDLAQEVERVAEENDISESDALRRLVRQGVSYDKHLSEMDDQLDRMDDQLDRIETETQKPLWSRWF